MLTKQQRALQAMTAFSRFRCPVCLSPMAVSGAALCCSRGHSYDVSRKGTVHLHHTTVDNQYDRALFEARRAVFEAGYYAPVAQAIRETLAPLAPTAILDAGCGEGYYLSQMKDSFPSYVMAGIDLAKAGIALSAGRPEEILWCVADLSRLPFQDNVFDAVMNILTPANYEEFSRVLRPGGHLLKIMPGKEYLEEIRKALPHTEDSYDEDRVTAHLKKHMKLISQQRIFYRMDLSSQAFQNFTIMTPLTTALSESEREKLVQSVPSNITIDLQLVVCTM